MKEILNASILTLSLDKEIIDKLFEHKIKKIENLWILSRKQLKDYNLTDSEITNIVIQLQLLGIDLNGKVYSRK